MPQELQALPRWLLWRLERRDNQPKPTKIPYTIDGELASSTDPATWTSFDKALAALDSGSFTGVGLAIAPPYVGIDLDSVRDPATRQTEQWAKEIVRILDSYTEVSPSGRGFHIWVKGQLPAGRRKAGRIEIYDDARYFTVSGAHIPNTPTVVKECVLTYLHQNLAEIDPKYKETKPEPAETRLAGAVSKATAEDLMAGNWEKFYASQSEADLALLTKLAIRIMRETDADEDDEEEIAELVLEAFEKSPLADRDKWKREDYRSRTLAKALESARRIHNNKCTDEELERDLDKLGVIRMTSCPLTGKLIQVGASADAEGDGQKGQEDAAAEPGPTQREESGAAARAEKPALVLLPNYRTPEKDGQSTAVPGGRQVFKVQLPSRGSNLLLSEVAAKLGAIMADRDLFTHCGHVVTADGTIRVMDASAFRTWVEGHARCYRVFYAKGKPTEQSLGPHKQEAPSDIGIFASPRPGLCPCNLCYGGR